VKFSAKAAVQLALLLVAGVVAVLPPGAATVERVYAKGVYPALQANLTSLSNRSPIALFDIAVLVFILIAIGIWTWSIRLARKKQRLRSLWRGVVATVTLLAVVYLWFLAAWGFNYARPPLESTMAYDAARVTPEAVRALAEYVVDRANTTHAAGHAAGFPAVTTSPQTLMDALHQVEKEFGRPRPTVFATPKSSIFTPFYRASGVSGQLGPFFLETLLNPDLTGPERPAVLAHEWAHLSGYAPESDASFIGLLAGLRAGPASEYSVWLDLVSESVNQLQPVTQRIVLEKLAQGPRDDLEAIRERLKQKIKPVEDVAWSSYDRMLKSQGVEEGIQSYSRVIQLLIGTDALKVTKPSASAKATADKQAQ
jgi:Zn-dependent protease with chaperone function